MGTQLLLFLGNSPCAMYSTERIIINGVTKTGIKRAKTTQIILVTKKMRKRFLMNIKILAPNPLKGAFRFVGFEVFVRLDIENNNSL
jgi:hypothetical protein